jgi:hypothetical protein
MWAFTQNSYVSIVQKLKSRPDELTVRGRDMESLNRFCDRAGIDRSAIFSKWPSDYPYRVVATRAQVEEWAIAEVRAIGYSNFKSRAETSRGKLYHDVLTSIWSATHRLTPGSVRDEMDKAWRRYDAEYIKRATKGKGKGSKGRGKSIVKDHWGEEPLTPEFEEEMSIHDMTEDQWRAFMESI